MTYECEPEPEGPVLWTDINGKQHTTPPGTMRTLSMNSKEFYEAVRQPRDPSDWGPCLGPEPINWGQPVVVDSDPYSPRWR